MFLFGPAYYAAHCRERMARGLNGSVLAGLRPHEWIMQLIWENYGPDVAQQLQESTFKTIRREGTDHSTLLKKRRWRVAFKRQFGDEEGNIFPAAARVIGRSLFVYGSDHLVELDHSGRLIPPRNRRFRENSSPDQLAPLRICFFVDEQQCLRFEPLLPR